LYKSEKHTIYYVLGLYLSSTLLLIATLFTSYYFYQQEQLFSEEKKQLKKYTLELTGKLLDVHEDDSFTYKYPRYENFKSAIYDSDKKIIFADFHEVIDDFEEEFFVLNKKSYYVSYLKTHYLGAAYIVVQKEMQPLSILSDTIVIAIVVIIITILTSIFLVKIVLKPMRDTLHLLDNFIKDTTHELNTPITTILANIETLDKNKCDAKSLKNLQRIKIASMSISNLYEDLVYLLLHQKILSVNKELNISQVLEERIHYFELMAQAKKLHFNLAITPDVVFAIDKQKFERLVDNIVSNAIKYTNIATTIRITLEHSGLSVFDEGNGMSEAELQKIYDKYVRFDRVQGGFGLGYSIIKSIADEYNIEIMIDSIVNKGTKVTLRW